jgi:hypothetical protein
MYTIFRFKINAIFQAIKMWNLFYDRLKIIILQRIGYFNLKGINVSVNYIFV